MKTKKRLTMSQKAAITAILSLLAFAFCVFLLKVFSRNISFDGDQERYANAYRPKVEQAEEARAMEVLQRRRANELLEDPPSDEPRPIGFREKDIDKAQGNRYKTW